MGASESFLALNGVLRALVYLWYICVLMRSKNIFKFEALHNWIDDQLKLVTIDDSIITYKQLVRKQLPVNTETEMKQKSRFNRLIHNCMAFETNVDCY